MFSVSGSHKWLAALATAGLMALPATLSYQMGVADLLVSRDLAASRRHWPSQAEASSRELQRLIGEPRVAPERIEALAKEMLASSALVGTGYAGLARVEEAGGNQVKAAHLMMIAAKRSPRERNTHAWLADYFVAKLDFQRALLHFDQILRLSPRQVHTLMPTLASLSAHPQGAHAVSQWLGEHAPPWRENYLRSWAGSAPTEELLDGVFDPLRRAAHPLTAEERDSWVGRLITQGRAAKAQYLWIEGLPEAQRQQVGNVFDGGFELPASNGGFGWRIGRVAGALIRQQVGTGVGGQQALVIEFQNRRVPFDHVQQLLALPSGSYRLAGRARLDDLRNDRGLQWVLGCTPDRIELMTSERFNGRRGWTNFSLNFEVPVEGCRTQLLRLRLDARVPAEQWVGGRAWFDDLRIVRRSPDAEESPNGAAAEGRSDLPEGVGLWQAAGVVDHVGVGEQGPK